MNNILQTTKAEWNAFFEEMAPRWLRWLKDNGTSVDSIEVYSPADYAEFAKRVRSLPARYDWEGVRKTVLVPVEILSRDAYNAKQEADKAAEEAREATKKADQAADSANKAAALAETAFDDLDQIKGETLAAAVAATQAANRATAAASEAEGKMAEFSSAEAARAAAERLRKDAEAARVNAENLRTEAESKRETAEKLRAEAEKKRQAAHELLEAFLANPPKIENGTWRTYSVEKKAYEDTGVNAIGRSPYVDESTGNWMVWNESQSNYEDSGINAATPDLTPIDIETFKEMWDNIS